MNLELIGSLFYILSLFLFNRIYRMDAKKEYKFSRTKSESNIGFFKHLNKPLQIAFLLSILFHVYQMKYLDRPFFYLEFYSQTVIQAGLALSLIGFTLFVLGRFTLGKEYSPCYDAYTPHRVIRYGVYKYLKHPIYIGNTLYVFGAFIFSGSAVILLLFLILGIFYLEAARQENKELYSTPQPHDIMEN